MFARHVIFAALVPFALLSACTNASSQWGFSLPKGDGAAGKATFAKLGCNACHTVYGHQDLRLNMDTEPEMSIFLGGVTENVQTYAGLVTSIINPSHRLSDWYPAETVSDSGKSKMRSYNSVMTVEEMTNLVTFLEAQYELLPYVPSTYSTLGY